MLDISQAGLFGEPLNRITIALKVALLLILSATQGYALSAQAGSQSAFESLKTFVPPAAFDSIAALPDAAAARAPMLSGERLFQELHRTVMPAKAAVAGYKQAKAYMYSKADNIGCNGAPGILTFYSQICVNGSSDNGNDYPERGDQNGDGVVDKFVNAEHIWPQGYFNSALPMVSDLHQLASTLYTPNSRRGNMRFAKVSNATYSTSCGSKLGSEGFEPCDPDKGNVARAMLYFVTRYYDQNIREGMNYEDFWTSRVPMLLEWNRQDPPDANERRRNDMVEAFQGNRNPYIDNPELADQISAAVFAAH